MRPALLNHLRCPVAGTPLRLEPEREDSDGHVMSGRLLNDSGAVYPIVEGVPYLLPEGGAQVDNTDLKSLQDATADRFGYEWRVFKDWGWIEDYPPDIKLPEQRFFGGLLKNSRSAFWNKSQFAEHELGPGRLVLDAGCGNGRFSYQTALTGAEVVGIDLGIGVHSAFEHMREMTNVHIVRGDLFRLPFPDRHFDRVFSIGVLMHTGNASAAFDSIARRAKPGGLVAIMVYGKGLPTYEAIDAAIRAVLTRLPKSAQMGFANLTAETAVFLRTGGRLRSRIYRNVFRHINLLPTRHHMFDWWSAPIATHHTREELDQWFERNDLEILRIKPPLDTEWNRRREHAALGYLGRRRDS